MESIRRRIKIFWLDHSDPIIFWSVIIVGVILITQFLNRLAIEEKEDENNANITNTINTESYVYNVKDKLLIEDFINYCKNNENFKAYDLLSKSCKEKLYPTYEDFVNNYYNKIFNKKRTVQITYQKEEQLYKVAFYTDILETGGFSKATEDYYKIEQDVIENKIYINFYQDI